MQFDHFYIRPLELSDLEPYYSMVEKNRSRLADFFAGTVSRTGSLEDTEKFLQEIEQKRAARSYFPFLIVDTHTDEIIGFLDLKNVDWHLPKSEVGLYIDSDAAGKGISTQAMAVFCDYCFAEFGFEKLFLRTHDRNKPAIAIAEKCGFTLEGTLRRDYKTTAGELVDLRYYGRLKNE